TWTLGVDVSPAVAPGFSAAMTYFNTRYADRIDRIQITPDVLFNSSDAWMVNRHYTSAELVDACTHSVYVGAPGTCLSSSVGAILDDRELNVQLLKTDGMDVLAKYTIDSAWGKFEYGLSGNYLFHYSQANGPGISPQDILGTQNNPINLRLRSSTHWTYGR